MTIAFSHEWLTSWKETTTCILTKCVIMWKMTWIYLRDDFGKPLPHSHTVYQSLIYILYTCMCILYGYLYEFVNKLANVTADAVYWCDHCWWLLSIRTMLVEHLDGAHEPSGWQLMESKKRRHETIVLCHITHARWGASFLGPFS